MEREAGVKKKNNRLWMVFGIVLVVGVVITIGIVTYSNSPAQRYLRQLQVADRYLEELDYEQAIVAYQAAIEIDPMQPEAYLGLADAYIGVDNYEAALAALEQGYGLTQDSRIEEKIAEIEALLNLETDVENETITDDGNETITEELFNENDYNEKLDEIQNMVEEWNQARTKMVYAEYMRSRDEIKEAYAPMIAEIEEFLSAYGESEDCEYLYYYLHEWCLLSGDMEKAKYYYDNYGDIFIPEVYREYYDDYGREIIRKTYSDGNMQLSTKDTSEIAGMELLEVYTFEYGEGTRVIKQTGEDMRHYDSICLFSYDDSGRLIYETQQRVNDAAPYLERNYEYISSDEAVCRSIWTGIETDGTPLTIDKWGYARMSD